MLLAIHAWEKFYNLPWKWEIKSGSFVTYLLGRRKSEEKFSNINCVRKKLKEQDEEMRYFSHNEIISVFIERLSDFSSSDSISFFRIVCVDV